MRRDALEEVSRQREQAREVAEQMQESAEESGKESVQLRSQVGALQEELSTLKDMYSRQCMQAKQDLDAAHERS